MHSLRVIKYLLFAALLTVVFGVPAPAFAKEKEHTVRAGESLARIADFYGVGQRDLRELNGLGKTEPVRAGQTLTIPSELRGGASNGHKVKRGDSIASIARKYKVTRKELMAANKLGKGARLKLGRTLIIPDKDGKTKSKREKSVKPRKLVKSGELVPGGVRHTIQCGQSLWVIARAYNTTKETLAKANGFEPETPLKAGQKILIPGAKKVVPMRIKGFNIQTTHFVAIKTNKSANLRLIAKNGRVNQRSRKILSRLAAPKKTKRVKNFHPRLLNMLQRVAERFPGHTIEIVSGYRPRKKGGKKSKHNEGRAIDFRVRGIPRAELYEFIKAMPKVGAGYYPNSTFVHLDVRDRKTLWTDVSGPGEPAQMVDPNNPKDAEAEADVETTE